MISRSFLKTLVGLNDAVTKILFQMNLKLIQHGKMGSTGKQAV